MSEAKYEITHSASGWVIKHDNELSEPYEMPEAAFEAAVTAASLSLRHRHDVVISLTHDRAAKVSQETSGAASNPNMQEPD
jgi:hypothetical protein